MPIHTYILRLTTLATLLQAGIASAQVDDVAERVARFESSALLPLVKNVAPLPNWTGQGDRFWIKNETPDGARFLIVDAATGKQQDAFDHAAMASALTGAGVEGASEAALPILALGFNKQNVEVTTAGGLYTCTVKATKCEKAEKPSAVLTELLSPDGKQLAFVRDYNLWLRDVASGQERAITTDGEEGYAYGTLDLFDTQRVERRRKGQPKPITAIHWSPDSAHLATMRVDLRAIEKRAYVTEHLPPDGSFTISHPDYVIVEADNIRPNREIAIFDAINGSQVMAQVDAAKLFDFAPVHFVGGSIWWNLKGGELYFVTGTFGGQTYGIAAMNLNSGKVRTVVEESEEHYYAFSARDYQPPSFHVSANGKEAIFYSQRSGSGQLYLYDAQSGNLKNAITDGKGVVFELIRVDEPRREVYFTAGGREAGRNPYHTLLYRVSFDGGKITTLTPEDAVHDFARASAMSGSGAAQFTPSGDYLVDVFSSLTQPPRMVIRDRNGKLIAKVQEADPAALEKIGWKPPERFVVKAADGKTDLYGVMFKPSNLDPKLKYAVVDQTYPGPQTDSSPNGYLEGIASFTALNAQATAEMGLIVVVLDGRGSTRRDREFRYAFAGKEDIFGAGDHKAAIENLARLHPWIDDSRVGITGASFGGYGSLRAALLFPDFFDVVVSHVGPQDYTNSILSADLTNQRFFGQTGTARDYQALGSNIAIIDRLQADLMLVYGEIDENVPFRSAITVFDALMKADKDFTSYVVPNANHGGAVMSPYIVKRQRRFFADHLGGPVLQ